MASFNKVILIGNLTRDPEVRTFANGGKVAKIGLAVNNRKKNNQTGQWEEVPMFIDVDVFNRGDTGTLANVVEQYCRKGSQICVEGKLHLDSWDDKTSGQKRTKHMVVADTITLLGTRPEGAGGEGGAARSSYTRPAAASAPASGGYDGPPDDMGGEPPPSSGNSNSGSGEEIPF